MPTQEDIALVRASFAKVVPIKDKAADLFPAATHYTDELLVELSESEQG
jgi:hypothetical protein